MANYKIPDGSYGTLHRMLLLSVFWPRDVRLRFPLTLGDFLFHHTLGGGPQLQTYNPNGQQSLEISWSERNVVGQRKSKLSNICPTVPIIAVSAMQKLQFRVAMN